MSEEKVEFKILESKLVGSDTVVFRLEDGTMVKVRIDVERAGVSTNFKNPDGSPYYHIDVRSHITLTPSGKKFSIPKSQLKMPAPKERTVKPI